MFKLKLINDSITKMINFFLIYINIDGIRFTQGSRVRQFEKEWSEWLELNIVFLLTQFFQLYYGFHFERNERLWGSYCSNIRLGK